MQARSEDGPHDFQPDFERLYDFLVGLPVFIAVDSALMELPINFPDLKQTMEAASTGRGLGLDGISYISSTRLSLSW